jgi:LacI family transcriptional regulator
MSHKARTAVTIRDVANHAHVGITTVSRVLNNLQNVRPETRARVFEAVKTLGYKPNISARSLASTRSRCIGIFYDDPQCSYFSMLLLGALERCREESYQLVIETFGDGLNAAYTDILHRIKQLTLDGVILPEPVCNNTLLVDALLECDIPYVRVSPHTDAHQAAYVCVDDYAAVYKLTDYLISLGHRELGVIRGREHDKVGSLRYEGFCGALRDRGLHCLPENQAFGNYAYSDGLIAAKKILSHKQRPTAILALNDEMAAAVIATANQLKLSVPGDLSVSGFDNSTIAVNVLPNLTTINQDIQELGRVAAEVLFGKIKNAGQESEENASFTILNYKTVIRDSTAAPKMFLGRRP